MLHVSALFEPSSGVHFKNYCFSVVLQFLSYCIGDPFCITNHSYCLYGVRCPLLFVQQWAPNTIQTIIMICNAKGIPNAIAQKL